MDNWQDESPNVAKKQKDYTVLQKRQLQLCDVHIMVLFYADGFSQGSFIKKKQKKNSAAILCSEIKSFSPFNHS